MYDPFLGRFVQADTIIPEAGKAGAYDRYAYSSNNPVNDTDPTGHCPDCVLAARVIGTIAPKRISEVKNVNTLSLTNQLKDFVAYAQQSGYTFKLWTRSTTKIAQPLQNLLNNGQIIQRILEFK